MVAVPHRVKGTLLGSQMYEEMPHHRQPQSTELIWGRPEMKTGVPDDYR